MDARHLTAPVTRRRRGNAVGLIALALTIAAATFALDPSGPPKLPSRARKLIAAPDGSGVLLVGTPESPVQRLANGSILGVGDTKSPDASAKAALPGLYSATATASIFYQGPGGSSGGRAIGTSAVNVSTDGSKMNDVSRLGTKLVDGDVSQMTAVGRVELLPGVAALSTQAASPSKENTTTFGALHPGAVPAGFTAVGGSAHANTVGPNACGPEHGNVVDATTELAGGRMVTVPLVHTFGTDTDDFDAKASLVSVEGAASSASLVELEYATLQYDDLHPTRSNAIAATARAKIRVPKFVIFPGSLYKVEVRILAPLELMATAGGVPGSARAHLYGALLDADRPVVSFTTLFGTQYITGRYFSTEDGIHIKLGNGGELHLGGVSALAAAGGKSATAVSDFVHLKLPDRIGPLHMSVDPDLGELIIETGPTISNVIKSLNKAFDRMPLPATKIPTGSVREFRFGHMEVDVRVPTGGVKCAIPDHSHYFGITDKDTGDRLGR